MPTFAQRTGVTLVLATLAIAEAAGAQASNGDARKTVTNAGPIVPFLEGTDVFMAAGQDTVFEADIVHHAIAFQTFADVLDLDRQAKRIESGRRPRLFAISISGTPAVRMRMLEQVSRPVRTPSWMPRGNIQLLWVRGAPEVADAYARQVRTAAAPGTVAAASGLPRRVSVWEVHAIVGHHSNGQDGCYYEDERRGADGTCESVTTPSVPRQVNTTDGSFSTNYVRLGMNYRRNTLDDDLWARREWGARAEVEHHPRSWMDQEIVSTYGRTRLSIAGVYSVRDWSRCEKRAEVRAGLQATAGRQPEASSAAITLEAACFPTQRGGWGVFVRYYRGQDYYNIRYLNDINRLHVGFTFNQSGFFRFCSGCTQGGGGL
jgi:hypothetical protein